MKIVFDTNVLISGFLTTTGPSQNIIAQTFKKHTAILSNYILGEFEIKLTSKFHVPHAIVQKAISYLKRRALVIELKQDQPSIEFQDKKDVPILHLIEATKPHYFITGDKRLLELGKRGPTLFLTPRQAMEILEEG